MAAAGQRSFEWYWEQRTHSITRIRRPNTDGTRPVRERPKSGGGGNRTLVRWSKPFVRVAGRRCTSAGPTRSIALRIEHRLHACAVGEARQPREVSGEECAGAGDVGLGPGLPLVGLGVTPGATSRQAPSTNARGALTRQPPTLG